MFIILNFDIVWNLIYRKKIIMYVQLNILMKNLKYLWIVMKRVGLMMS